MNSKKWNAILAVNLIARHQADNGYVIERLKEIEAYLGTANLPGVEASAKESMASRERWGRVGA